MKALNANNDELKRALRRAEKARSELDNEIFLLRALQDTARQLTGRENIREIMEIFLLMTMGTFGTMQGFVLLIDTEVLEGQVASRNLEDADIKMLRENTREIINQYFSTLSEERASSEVGVHLIPKEGLESHSFCPPQTNVLIQWNNEKKYAGLVGLGEKISTKEYSDTDIEILLSFTNHLMISINHAISMGIIRDLNLNLNEKNIALEKALKLRERAQKELDKRLFHLIILYDTSRELSGIKEIQKIMDAFLLMVMGTFSAAQGYILLLDKNDKMPRLSYRGIEKEKVGIPSEDDVEKIRSKLFKSAEARKMAPVSVEVVADKQILDNRAIPMDAAIGLLFVMDESSIGIIGLGKKVTAGGYSEEDRELLLTLVNNFMPFMENSRSFDTIKKLNVDLEKGNIELRKTIDDLRASRDKIEILERTKARIKSAIQRQSERTGRVTAMDFLSILVFGLLLGIIFNFANPGGINIIPQSWLYKSPPPIEVRAAKIKYNSRKTLFVDARPVEFYEQKRIKGAVNLPLTLFDFMYTMKFSNIDPQKEIIVYGRSISRQYDKEVALKLSARGHMKVKILSATFSKLEEEGYPLEP